MNESTERASKLGRGSTSGLIGREVWFRGQVWRVVSASGGNTHGSPWLTLMRGFGIKAMAKRYEVIEAFN